MRPIAVILVVVAAIAASLAAFLAKRWVDTASSAKPAETVALVEVLVASHEIVPGTVLKDGDLRYDKWPKTVVVSNLAVRTPGHDPKSDYVNAVARYQFADGEPLTPAKVFKSETGGLLSAILQPGMRAISLAVTPVSGVSGLVAPGDHVDVLLAEDMSRAANGTKSALHYASEKVLEDIRVLAIDQQVTRSRDGAAIQGKTATLEVTGKQAEILTTAGMLGPLSLILRSAAHAADDGKSDDTADKKGFTSDADVSRALQSVVGGGSAVSEDGDVKKKPTVQINRAGAISSKSF